MSAFLRLFYLSNLLSGSFGAVVAAIVLVLIVVINASWVAYTLNHPQYLWMWTVKSLRQFASLIATALYIPLLGLLAQVLNCTPSEPHPTLSGLVCWQGTHAALSTIVIVALAVFLPICFLLSATYMDQTPNSASITSRPHGRAEVVKLTVKTVLTLVFVFFLHVRVLLLLTVLASGVVLTITYTRYMPYYRLWIVKFKAATASIFLWGGICLVVSGAFLSPVADIQ